MKHLCFGIIRGYQDPYFNKSELSTQYKNCWNKCHKTNKSELNFNESVLKNP